MIRKALTSFCYSLPLVLAMNLGMVQDVGQDKVKPPQQPKYRSVTFSSLLTLAADGEVAAIEELQYRIDQGQLSKPKMANVITTGLKQLDQAQGPALARTSVAWADLLVGMDKDQQLPQEQHQKLYDLLVVVVAGGGEGNFEGLDVHLDFHVRGLNMTKGDYLCLVHVKELRINDEVIKLPPHSFIAPLCFGGLSGSGGHRGQELKTSHRIFTPGTYSVTCHIDKSFFSFKPSTQERLKSELARAVQGEPAFVTSHELNFDLEIKHIKKRPRANTDR